MLLLKPGAFLCSLCKGNFRNSTRRFSVSPKCLFLWEKDEKGGYKDNRPQPSFKEKMRDGFKELKDEISLWSQEVKEKFEFDPLMSFRPGEVDVLWKFGDEAALKNWKVTNDSDNNEGFSSSSLTLTNQGKGLFSGYLSMRVPKDGRVKRAGYCNIKTLDARKSFKRQMYWDWNNYNMLVFKVRGDGRSYMLNIHCKGYYDIMWNDVYHYVLYTRGGPYWQIARIPFSKFFLGAKGRVQDRQSPVPLSKITSFGITSAERHAGEFSLEIDYIGLEYDPNHQEEFAYEMYSVDRNLAGY